MALAGAGDFGGAAELAAVGVAEGGADPALLAGALGVEPFEGVADGAVESVFDGVSEAGAAEAGGAEDFL